MSLIRLSISFKTIQPRATVYVYLHFWARHYFHVGGWHDVHYQLH